MLISDLHSSSLIGCGGDLTNQTALHRGTEGKEGVEGHGGVQRGRRGMKGHRGTQNAIGVQSGMERCRGCGRCKRTQRAWRSTGVHRAPSNHILSRWDSSSLRHILKCYTHFVCMKVSESQMSIITSEALLQRVLFWYLKQTNILPLHQNLQCVCACEQQQACLQLAWITPNKTEVPPIKPVRVWAGSRLPTASLKYPLANLKYPLANLNYPLKLNGNFAKLQKILCHLRSTCCSSLVFSGWP